MGSKHSKGTTSTSDLIPRKVFRMPFEALQEATNNFDYKFLIEESDFGKVYKGVLCGGRKVALKRYVSISQQVVEKFQKQIEILSHRHPNLVLLIGYCDDNNEMILIFEYLNHENLWNHLYESALLTSSWEQRLKICIGVARGLHYLHTNRIIHRDVKSPDILLDENFVPKIADFGSKAMLELDQTYVRTPIERTRVEVDPEYFMRRQLTEKSDVYSLGVVLFEVLCAGSPTVQSMPGEIVSLNIAAWAMDSQRRGMLEKIIDPNLAAKIRPGSLRKFGETAVKCLAISGVDRPSMGDVLQNLEYALHLQQSVI
ncbi:hypothetical protein EJD97_017885 [Solanum chilense]|uniref:Protein kinase domain-containing protein n=1 Tax=Solanum chilense TaxID=4083 RepID=A0A6N2B4M4_SOLCI|nr:hypothetical protein EJD97_017885 [Solanum chilense]